MTGHVATIWRDPIKAHGHEHLDRVFLSAGHTIPWDKTWAIAHEASSADGRDWTHCSNFTRGAKAPGLQAITARLNGAGEEVTLAHPDSAKITFRPDANPQTGQRDVGMLGVLRAGWGYANFGVYGEVVTDGDITIGDTADISS